MNILNQFSYVIVLVVVGLVLLVIMSRIPQLNIPMQIGIIVAYVMMAFFVGKSFQYPDSPVEAETIADVENTLINEKPTFVMLYSNY